ncbi:HNH endonuclease [Planococcus faecalis]|uniref:HNH endonuclease n=1 Tax=Planococcus faecalis TaxID=1598147 RepID=UPI00210A24D7|nr:SAVED domain-containing protein [Planococcus faecalis]
MDSKVEKELWARAAGRCQFSGCNRLLYKSPVTQESVNISEKAHIYSFSKSGPRGWGPFKTKLSQLNSIENLALMCHDCHKLIDADKEGEKYSGSLLQQWKREHEKRIATITGIASDKKSHIVFYGSNIGAQFSPLNKEEAIQAIFPNRYPAEENPVVISMTWSQKDHSPEFWNAESANLKTEFKAEVEKRIQNKNGAHFSLFSLAPMPLLIQLGTLFTDKVDVDVYQPIREPKTWVWQEFPEGFEFLIKEPIAFVHPPVLVISLSDKVSYDRIHSILGQEVSIWELTVKDDLVGNDIIRSKAQLAMMRTVVRQLMSSIKEKHGFSTPLSIFPAMAVSCAVEMGRARMPKAEMPWVIYDQNNHERMFIKTLTLGENE